MQNVSIARRYARALLEVSGPKADAVLQSLQQVVDLFEAPELRDLLERPTYTKAQRHAVVEKLIAHLSLDGATVGNLLRLLIDRGRMAYLPDICRLFREQADLKAGRVRGRVVSAMPLPSAAVAALQSSFKHLTAREVVLETSVDEALLGGVRAQVGSLVFDGSLRSQLNELRRHLESMPARELGMGGAQS